MMRIERSGLVDLLSLVMNAGIAVAIALTVLG